MQLAVPFLVSFVLTAVLTPLVIRMALHYNCVDVPGDRHRHERNTPRWGGLAFYTGVLPVLVAVNAGHLLTAYLIAASLLVLLGLLDDLSGFGCRIKFAVMIFATAAVVFGGDLVIHRLGDFGPLGRVELGSLSVPFTFLGILGITNAINLLDGMNGLAAGVSLVAFLFLGVAAMVTGNLMLAAVCFAFAGALAAFLFYNFPRASVFMGDAGSLFLGFTLAVVSIMLTQSPGSAIEPMYPLMLLLVPVFDTIRVIFLRLSRGVSPFVGDNLHLHFQLRDRQVPPVQVTLFFWALTALSGFFGLSLLGRGALPYCGIAMSMVLYLQLLIRPDSVAVLLGGLRRRRPAGYGFRYFMTLLMLLGST